jgi:hypothetical protein
VHLSPVSRRKTDNTATDLGFIFVGREGEMDSVLTVSVGLAFNRPTPLAIHLIYLDMKELYFIFKTHCIICLCFIFHNVPFMSQFYLFSVQITRVL